MPTLTYFPGSYSFIHPFTVHHIPVDTPPHPNLNNSQTQGISSSSSILPPCPSPGNSTMWPFTAICSALPTIPGVQHRDGALGDDATHNDGFPEGTSARLAQWNQNSWGGPEGSHFKSEVRRGEKKTPQPSHPRDHCRHVASERVIPQVRSASVTSRSSCSSFPNSQLWGSHL
jgi:hypothetical protein